MNSIPANPPGYRDRRAALLVAGIVEIVLGLGAWLMVGLVYLGARLAQANGMPMASMVPGLLMYGGAGTVFIVLGIGSIRLRRWARSLWLVVSAGWALVGLLSLVGMIFWLPVMMNAMPPGNASAAGVVHVVMVVTAGFILFLMVVVPLAIFFFYRGRNVRETIEAAQTARGWTDDCPLPVLGAATWLAVMALSLIPMPLAYGGLFPLFGAFVGGWVGTGLWWAIAFACAIAALGLLARRIWAWSIALVVVVLLGATSLVTYWRADLREMYEAMGISGPQLEQFEKMGMLQPGFLMGSTGITILLLLALLVWVRFYLRPPAPNAGLNPSSAIDRTELPPN